MHASTAASAPALRAAHERFVTAPQAPPGVRGLVAESWRRCAATDVRPDGGRLPSLRTTPEELAAYRRTHPLVGVLPLFRELLGAGAADDGHLFAVGDAVGHADGTLLWVEGDRATLGRAEAMHFAEGALWSEPQAGTNAPGTALELARPAQIVAGEHYSPAAHAWSCAAAPVRDPATARLPRRRRHGVRRAPRSTRGGGVARRPIPRHPAPARHRIGRRTGRLRTGVDRGGAAGPASGAGRAHRP